MKLGLILVAFQWVVWSRAQSYEKGELVGKPGSVVLRLNCFHPLQLPDCVDNSVIPQWAEPSINVTWMNLIQLLCF